MEHPEVGIGKRCQEPFPDCGAVSDPISRRVAKLERGSLDRLERRRRPDRLSLLLEVLLNQLQGLQLAL